MTSPVINRLKTDLETAKAQATTLWEKYEVFMHSHPRSACVIALIVGFVLGAILL